MRGFGGDCQAGLSRWRRRGWCASRQAADGAVAAIPVRRSAWPRLASGAESPERDRTAGGRIGAAARAFDQRASHRYAALHARAHCDATGDRSYDRDLGRGAQDATDGNLSDECRKVARFVGLPRPSQEQTLNHRTEQFVMAVTQLDKGNSFRAFHQGTRAFVIGNAWDAGSARVLAGLGFAAIATSSYATAGAYGTRDGRITRDQALAHARAIVDATDLPVSADLESGFGATANDVAETYRHAAAVGLVGATIEDATPQAESTSRCSTAARRPSASPPPWQRRASSDFRSCSPRAPKASGTATPILTTRSSACRPTRRRARTC